MPLVPVPSAGTRQSDAPNLPCARRMNLEGGSGHSIIGWVSLLGSAASIALSYSESVPSAQIDSTQIDSAGNLPLEWQEAGLAQAGVAPGEESSSSSGPGTRRARSSSSAATSTRILANAAAAPCRTRSRPKTVSQADT